MTAPDPRRSVPRTDSVLADPRLRAATGRLGPRVVKRAVVEAQSLARAGVIAASAVPDAAVSALPTALTSLQPVINATGVVLHTNLGRAPLSAAAVDALLRSVGYASVEYDTRTGRRAQRGRGTLAALQEAVPSAEAVLVVDNGAAISSETGCILKVHPSNFRIEGFTAAASVAELASLGVPLVADIGSGLLAPDPLLPDEPDASTTLRDGASVVTCSADKLLGGPQAGLIFGEKDILERLR